MIEQITDIQIYLQELLYDKKHLEILEDEQVYRFGLLSSTRTLTSKWSLESAKDLMPVFGIEKEIAKDFNTTIDVIRGIINRNFDGSLRKWKRKNIVAS